MRYFYLTGFTMHLGFPETYACTPASTRYHHRTKHRPLYPAQLKHCIGLGYPWNRAVKTSDPTYCKWTQYIFLLLFSHWYDKKRQKARPIHELTAIFETTGNLSVEAATSYVGTFTAEEWKSWNEKQRSDVLMHYRLAYTAEGMVNWCPALGTVLANEEVKDGFSERGGHPVYRVPMRQWFCGLRRTEQLLEGLEEMGQKPSRAAAQLDWALRRGHHLL